MLPRERVIKTILHEKPDRIPVYGWVKLNLEKQIRAEFGSVEAFEDKYEFDLAHLFGGPYPYHGNIMDTLRCAHGGVIEPAHLLEVELADPDDTSAYADIIAGIEHHKIQRGRFVSVQTPGIFEILNDPFTIQNHLLYLLTHENDLHKVYRRQARWNIRFAHNCIDLGVDMVQVSDDWGGQQSLLFDPRTWWRLIYPYHKMLSDEVRGRGTFLGLHSDGCITPLIDGILKLGYDVVHPWQESAGMSLDTFKERYRSSLTVMGGLDVQSVLGFGNIALVKEHIDRLLRMFVDGGLILCTSHYVQDHCTVEELRFAFDTIHDKVRLSQLLDME